MKTLNDKDIAALQKLSGRAFCFGHGVGKAPHQISWRAAEALCEHGLAVDNGMKVTATKLNAKGNTIVTTVATYRITEAGKQRLEVKA